MADNRRPSSVPSEDYYKTRMANSNNTSRKSSMQAGGQSPQFICSDRSLFIFSKDNLIRKICRTIVESKPFEYFILLTIFVNCILLAANKPLPKEDKSDLNVELEKAEIYLLAIFCLEAALKIVALGFLLHSDSYLRNGWNVLDFIVVVTGLLSLPELNAGIDAGSLKALRAARVLRPLKLVSGIPSLQVVMKSIMCAMVPLLQICLLVGFVVIIYAIIGLEFLNGKFHYVCHNNETGKIENPDSPQICDPEGKGRSCKPPQQCREFWEGPNDGITSFDNIFAGMLTVFQVITNEGWTDIMYWTFHAADANGYAFWIYYCSLVIIGSFFMLNLVLGVLSGEFAKERERVENRRAFLKVRRTQKMERHLHGYIDWISKAEDLMLEEDEEEDGDRNVDVMRRRNLDRVEDGDIAMTAQVLTGQAGRRHRLNTGKKKSFWQRFSRRNKRWKIRIRQIVKHQAFYWVVLVCVFLNTLITALQHYRQPEWLTQFQDIAEIVFISFFFCEMTMKLYGLGPQLYFKSQFNTFDCVVVCCGILELILSKTQGISLGISVLRALRLLRLFKFTRYWSSLRNLVTSLLSSVRSILSLLFLLFLFIVIFALLGMQIFGARFRELPGRKENPRTNFDDFANAALAVFQILTGEDWNAVMYDGVLSYDFLKPGKGYALAWAIYFVLLVVLGNYVLLNVFLAIAVDNLANAQQLSQDEEAEETEREERKKNILDQYRERGSPGNSAGRNGDAGMVDDLGPNEDEFESEMDDRPSFISNLRNPSRMVPQQLPGEEVPIIDTWSLFLFPPGNPVRKACHWLVNLRYFDNTILVIILISSVLLALEDPVVEGSDRNRVLTYFDYVFTTIFALEVIVKLIDYGAILHPGSYFRDAWNCIDCLVVCCAVASLVMSQQEGNIDQASKKIVKVLRVLRVLRPLKAINKAKKLKAVFQCMVYSLKNVLNILIITILFLFIFSVIGVQLFQGKFFYCDDASKMTEEECQGQYFEYDDNLSVDKAKDRSWGKHEYNFDNVLYAMLALFTSSTGEGWPALMQASIDATEVDKGPITDNKIEIALFYIFFVVVFSFFFINIFVALIILTFQEQGEKDQGDCELDRNQRDCLHFAIVAKPSERFMPEDPNTWQYRIWRIVDSRPFEYFIMLLIALNTLILTMKYYKEPKLYRSILDIFNTIFTFMFTGEAILKLFAFRLNYFRDGWNVFDFIIVLGSLLDFGLQQGMQSSGGDKQMPFDPSLFRLFRAARLIKLLRQGYTIRILLWTFLQSFKALPYVGMLIGLLFFIYAVIGMQMFGQISVENEEDPWAQISSQNNFQSFPQAIQVLFRSATGENWQLIMLACAAGAKCDERVKDPPETCGSSFTYVYFITFIFFCSFLLLNLFVAVIMDNFEYLTRDESILGPHHLDEFVRVWSEFDPGATGRIKHTEVCQLLRQMSPPVGIGKKCPKIVAYKRLIKMNMPLYPDNTVTFTATLFALVRTSLKILTEKNNLKENDKELRAMLKRVWPKLTKKTLDKVVPKPPSLINNANQANQQPQMTVGKIYCAKLIYENYKFMRRKGQIQAKDAEQGNALSRLVGGHVFHKFRGENDPELGEGLPMRDVAISLADGPYNSGSTQGLYHPNHQVMESPSRSRYPHQVPPVAHQSTTSLNEGRVTTSLVGPHRRQLPHAPGSRTGSQLSLTGKGPVLPENRGDGVLENGYHPNMNQHIAMAIRSGQSPYAIYGLEEMGDEDDWC
ncbi:voltage-dependent L-type calcium channel subunit alpha-1D-like isoform X2 [Acropora palmata]|uniref:voltage-dependent L-type calcium channel subunit alpha-1D-like isoform X2 n=1 Tax=Acropora palmata TaxID=6131 RepID=UPI003DA16E69